MVGMTGDRLVHGVIKHLGEEMVHRLLIGAADIHAGPPAHRLEPFQHLDIGGRVAPLGARGGRAARLRLGWLARTSLRCVFELGEQVARCGGFAHGSFGHQGLHESHGYREQE
jgi:hypothetical protein